MKWVRWAVIVVLIGVMVYSGIRVLEIAENDYALKQSEERERKYEPVLPPEIELNEPVINQEIIDLQGENNDVVGWLKVPNTQISYPFVQAEDNSFYLRRGLDKEYLWAGTLFMDYRCQPDVTGFNTIIYGHHMQNTKKFYDLGLFEKTDFFNANTSATIFLPYENLDIEIFAYLVVKSTDEVIYGVGDMTDKDVAEYTKYIREKARKYRDVILTPQSRVITLSTCTYEFTDARIVVLGLVK